MAGFTDYLEANILDHIFRASAGGTAYMPQPPKVYLALHTSDPTDTGLVASEVSSPVYARKEIVFGPPLNGTIANTNVPIITLPTCTVTFFSLCDAPTNGHYLITDSLASEQTFASGSTFQPLVGAITVTLD